MIVISKFIDKYRGMSQAVKAAMVYTIASFTVQGIHLITTPIFTRIMSVDQIGVVSNYSTWGSYFGTIIALGLTSGAINIALKDYKNDRVGYIKSSQTLVTISTVAFALITALLFPYISGFIGLPWYYMVLMFVTMLFGFSQSFWMSWQRYEYKYKAVGLVTISCSLLASVGSLLTVIWAKKTAIEDLAFVRLLSYGAISLLFSVPIFIYFLTRKKPLFRKDYAVFSLTIGLPMVVHSFSKSLLSASDRIMINAMEGSTALGLYSVLYTVGSLSLIVWESINSSFVPYFFEKLDAEKNNTNDIKRISFSILVLFGAASFLFALFAPEMVMIIGGKKYMEAVYVAPPVCAGIFYIALYSLYGNILMYYKKTKYIMYCTLAAALFNIGSNIILIPIYGYIAAAYTTLFSYMLMAAIYLFITKKIEDRQIYNNRTFWLISAVVVGLCLCCNLLYFNAVVRYLVIGIMLISMLLLRRPIITTLKQLKKK